MAQVNPFNFQLNPSSLAQLSNVRPDYMPDVWQWQQSAAQHDQVGLADLMRNAEHEKAMDPGRLKQQQATLESTIANTEGTRLDNQGKVMKNELDQHLLPQKKIQQFQELILKGNEADEKLAQLEIDKMLRNPDPKVQAQGKQLLDASRKAVEEKRKADSDWANKEKEIRLQNQGRMAEIDAQGANAERVARIGADSRLEVARLKAKETATDIIGQVKAGKMTYERAATALFLLGNLTDATDPLKEKYLALAADMEKANLAAKNAGAKPQVDLEGMGVPTTTPQAAPALGTPNPATAERPARQAAAEGNKRITIYKDGKAIGTIPESQKNQAIKEGYTVK